MWNHFDGDTVDVRVSEKCGAYIMIQPARFAEVEALLRNARNAVHAGGRKQRMLGYT